MTIEKHLTTRELAEAMSCSQDTVLRLAQKGDLESVFWGRERRYPESGVNRYLARTSKKANAPSADVIQLRSAQ